MENNDSKTGKGSLLSLLATLLLLLSSLVLIWEFWPHRPNPVGIPKDPVSVGLAHVLGSGSARAAIIEFSDFQCPYCDKFARTTMPELLQRYVVPGKLLFVFRHFPLKTLHPLAEAASVAAECAGKQDKFWQMHDLLVQDPSAVTSSSLRMIANRAGVLDVPFDECMAANDTTAISADLKLGDELGVTGTPTFFIGTFVRDRGVDVSAKLSGAKPIADFVEAIEGVLNGHRPFGTVH